MGCFSGRLMSAASDQKLFCKLCSPFSCSFDEFVEEKVISPSYSSAILTPPPQKEFLNSVMFPLCSFFLYFVSIRKYQVDIRDQGWGSQGFCKIRFWAVGLGRVAKATMQPGWWQTHGHVLFRVETSRFLTHMCTLELKDRKSLLWYPWTSFREGPWDSAESSIGKIKIFFLLCLDLLIGSWWNDIFELGIYWNTGYFPWRDI